MIRMERIQIEGTCHSLSCLRLQFCLERKVCASPPTGCPVLHSLEVLGCEPGQIRSAQSRREVADHDQTSPRVERGHPTHRPRDLSVAATPTGNKGSS